jgi:hypothetical protein
MRFETEDGTFTLLDHTFTHLDKDHNVLYSSQGDLNDLLAIFEGLKYGYYGRIDESTKGENNGY